MTVTVAYVDGHTEPFECNMARTDEGILKLRLGPMPSDPFVSIPLANVRHWTTDLESKPEGHRL